MNKTTEPAALAGIEPVAIEYCGRCDKATLPYDFNTTFYSAATVERLVQERDFLDHKAKCLDIERRAQDKWITEGQAREQQLREALKFVRLTPEENAYWLTQLDAAIALPQDDTALRQWGAKLLREMADAPHCKRNLFVRDELRRKADELEGKK